MTTFNLNDIVTFAARRAGRAHGVVVSIRRITRGRHRGSSEYTVGVLTGAMKGKGYLKATGGGSLTASDRSFTDDEITEARGDTYRVAEDRATSKRARTERARDGLGEVSIMRDVWGVCAGAGGYGPVLYTDRFGPGDTVLINRERPWTAKVLFINPKNGKVAIEAPRNKTGYRYIHPNGIVETRQEKRALPYRIDSVLSERIKAEGSVSLRAGEEFIERSAVVAETRLAALRGGPNYECASATVYQDPDTGLYWRETGSFD